MIPILIGLVNKRGTKTMTRRDGDDGAFPVKGRQPKQKQMVGEADPNSRAANWLREAAQKPPIVPPVKTEGKEAVLANPISESDKGSANRDDAKAEEGDEDGQYTIGQMFDMAIGDLVDYVVKLENTQIEMYNEAKKLADKVNILEQILSNMNDFERDFRALQTIVLAIQSNQRYNFAAPIVPNFNDAVSYPYNPTTIASGDTAPFPFNNPPKMREDEMDKE